MADTKTGTDDIGVGYIEFLMDGTNYSGHYVTTSNIGGDKHRYDYDLDMVATKNLVGMPIFSITVNWNKDGNIQNRQFSIDIPVGGTLHISQGSFKLVSFVDNIRKG